MTCSRDLIKRETHGAESSDQSSVAEWLRLCANQVFTPPLCDWEIMGSNPTAGMSRIGFLSREVIPMVFPDQKCFSSLLHPTRSPCGLFAAVYYCCKINKV